MANTHVAYISRERRVEKQKFANLSTNRSTFQPKSFALISGNGPRDMSANFVKDRVITTLQKSFGHNDQGDIYIPKFSISNVPSLGYSMDMDKYWHIVLHDLIDEVRTLAGTGKFQKIGVPCNTVANKIFDDEIQNALDGTGVEYISMPQKVLHRFKTDYDKKQLKGNSVAVLGIGTVADLNDDWSRYADIAELDGINIEDTTHLVSEITQIGFRIKQGDITGAYSDTLDLIKNGVKSKNVILALTELSLAFKEFGFSSKYKQYYDTLDIYADEFAKEVTGIDPEIIRKHEMNDDI